MEVPPAARVVDEALRRPGACSGSTKTCDESVASSESVFTASEVCCASLEMVRARDATHKAVALRRAATAGETEFRNGANDVSHMRSNLRVEGHDDLGLAR